MSDPNPPSGPPDDDDPFRKRPQEPPAQDGPPPPSPPGQPGYGAPQYGAPQYGAPGSQPPDYGPPQPQWGAPAPYLQVPPGYFPVFNTQGQQVLVPLASPGKRFATYLLEFVLSVVTLGIGYVIWMLIAWGNGQTPGKVVTKLRYVDVNTGRVATWGKSAFRDFVIRGIAFYFITIFTLTIGFFIAAFMTLDGKRNFQAGWDRMASTVVVDVSNVQL